MKKMFLVALAVISIGTVKASTYNCFSQDHWDPTIPSVLSINKKMNIVSVTNTLWCSDFSAEVDVNYKPKTLKSFVRFIASDCSADGITYILLDENMLSGKLNGKMKIQNRGEMFVNNQYDCIKIK